MTWNSSCSDWERGLGQGLLYTILLPSPGTTGESLGWKMAGGVGTVWQKGVL